MFPPRKRRPSLQNIRPERLGFPLGAPATTPHRPKPWEQSVQGREILSWTLTSLQAPPGSLPCKALPIQQGTSFSPPPLLLQCSVIKAHEPLRPGICILDITSFPLVSPLETISLVPRCHGVSGQCEILPCCPSAPTSFFLCDFNQLVPSAWHSLSLPFPFSWPLTWQAALPPPRVWARHSS